MNKTVWALLFCLIGAAGLFLPWHGNYPVGGFPMRLGIFAWHGGATGTLLLLLFLGLVSTEPLDPTPAWRSVVLGAMATAALVVFNVYGYGPGKNWVRFVGPWITLTAIVGLLVVAALELREHFGRERVDGRDRPE